MTKTLILPCTNYRDDYGPFVAVLHLSPAFARSLVKAADALRAAKQIDPDLYEVSQFNYKPDFFENDDSEQVNELFEASDSENEPFDAEELSVPETGNVRADYCILHVKAVGDAGVSYVWEMCVKHTSSLVETASIEESYLIEWLANI